LPAKTHRKTLKEWRKTRGLTQKSLGRLVGLAQSTIAMYESARRTPNIGIITAIAEKLGITLDEIDFTPYIKRSKPTTEQPVRIMTVIPTKVTGNVVVLGRERQVVVPKD